MHAKFLSPERCAAHEDHGKDFPGFRFQPTEEELVGFYLRRKSQGTLPHFEYIPMIDFYRYEPWCLPSCGEEDNKSARYLYFFVERKHEACIRKGGRLNRVTASGYWKATGSERSIWDDSTTLLGYKKTLVFYMGRAPKGVKTDWIMNEYRLHYAENGVVLCRIHKKAKSQKWLERQAFLKADLQQQQQYSNHSCHAVCASTITCSDSKTSSRKAENIVEDYASNGCCMSTLSFCGTDVHPKTEDLRLKVPTLFADVWDDVFADSAMLFDPPHVSLSTDSPT